MDQITWIKTQLSSKFEMLLELDEDVLMKEVGATVVE